MVGFGWCSFWILGPLGGFDVGDYVFLLVGWCFFSGDLVEFWGFLGDFLGLILVLWSYCVLV